MVGAKEWEKGKTPQETWLRNSLLGHKFPQMYLISLQKEETVANMGFYDGLQWQWNLVWRRRLFQWEGEQIELSMTDLKEVHLSKFTKDKTLWHFNL